MAVHWDLSVSHQKGTTYASADGEPEQGADVTRQSALGDVPDTRAEDLGSARLSAGDLSGIEGLVAVEEERGC